MSPSPRAVRSSWAPAVGLFGPRSRYAAGRLSRPSIVIDLTAMTPPRRRPPRPLWGAAVGPAAVRREHKVPRIRETTR